MVASTRPVTDAPVNAPNASELDLNNQELRLRTAGSILPPAKFGPQSDVQSSLVSPAAQVYGRVHRSVISPEVVIEEGAEVVDSVIHHGCIIRSGARIHRSILDKEVTVGRGAVIGDGDPTVPNVARPDIVYAGITIVGKRVTIPAGLHIGRNVIIGPGVEEELAGLNRVEDGATIQPTQIPLHLFV